MTNLNHDLTILLHMKKYTEEITKIDLNKITYKKFTDDYILRNSVSMDLLQIGELVNHLSKEYYESTKEKMKWNIIKGMRNHFAHGYFSMDYQIILDTAKNNIPEFQKLLNQEINKLNKE